MGKALEGAALLAGAVGMGVAAFMDPALVASPLFDKIWASLIISGVSMEAAAIAGALTSNRGQNITTRQAASYRQIIYGQQRVGGVTIFRSTTGGSHSQYNYVIVLAGHEIDSIQNLYLDGRQVHWVVGSGGNSTRNGVNFGGNADSGTYTGPNGVQYNFGSGNGYAAQVYCEARYGDQSPGDVITGLTANDPAWAPDANGNSPWVGGCAYVYLKVEYNTSQFPGEPEIRFTVNGKNNIYDPRTNSTKFTSNWALVAADIITDPVFGLGDASVNQAQLIAAANVCDEDVEIAIGGVESRYTCNHHYDTSTAPGDALNIVMPAAAGRMSRIGGEWYIWPAYWQGPSFSFGESNLTGSVQWTPYRSFRDLVNRVTGTYTAPTYPWNVTGNLYDANGFYNGQIQNNFPFAWQSTNFPMYAADVLHGYASDEYLAQDGGKQLPRELNLNTVISLAQAQRVAKINLLRNRQQGSGLLRLNLTAFQMQPCDTFLFSYGENGWVDKTLEVETVKFQISTGDDQEPPSIRAEFNVIETAASVYDWDVSEELSVYDVPIMAQGQSYTPAAPTNMALSCSAATAVISTTDGTATPRIKVTWDTPQDVAAVNGTIHIQYQVVGASSWIDAGSVSTSVNQAYISGVVSGVTYNVQIQTVRNSGATSPWVSVNGFTAGLTLSSQTSVGIGIGSLVADGYSSGNAGIVCTPFTALIGQLSLSIFTSGEVTLLVDGTLGGSGAALAQQTLYYVYYVDPTIAGGNVTPIATTNQRDFLGKNGYFLIDSIVTPYASSGGSGTSSRYYPFSGVDAGSRTTANPTAAYDTNLSTFASISGFASSDTSSGIDPTYGDFLVGGWQTGSSTSASTLVIILAAQIDQLGGGSGGSVVVYTTIGTTSSTLVTLSATTSKTTYTATIPAGVDRSTVGVEVSATPGTPGSQNCSASASLYETYIQI
ncbi:phage tail protein [Granulicella paludicola]|uniref:hypothetical protein n=1 Tax=Granulicella paludicola TaxID=474951 RepID=UPI0021DF8CC2|nr:hypothetical protein [Granulicella paludicola]